MPRLPCFVLLALIVMGTCGCGINRNTKLEDFRPLAVGGRIAPDSPGNAGMYTVSGIRPENLVIDGNKIEWNPQNRYGLALLYGFADVLLSMTYSENEAREPYPFLLGLMVFDHTQLSGQSGTDPVTINRISPAYTRAASKQVSAGYSFMYPVYERSLFASAGLGRNTRRIDLFTENLTDSASTPKHVYLRNFTLMFGARWIPLPHTLVSLDVDAWQSPTETASNVPSAADRGAVSDAFPFTTRVHATVSFLF